MSLTAPGSEPAAAIGRWLKTEAARAGDAARFVTALGEKLRAAGVPVDRITTGVPILHPNISSASVLWEPGKAPVERRWILDATTAQSYDNSPLKVVYNGGGKVRCRIGPTPVPGEYGIIPDLRREGFSDYLALPLPFSDGSTKALTVATRTAAGFTDADLAAFDELAPTIAMVLEIHTLHRTARTLLDTYVGPVAGARVLSGAIRRGMGETIHAVIWVCDLRGFTALSDNLPQDEMILLLNDYFGAMTKAIETKGGEVLKFIGDALLAIFPVTAASSDNAVARSALAAAADAHAALATVNATRAAAGRPAIRFGLALHVGDVMYGNIGGEARLDFTVIGPAVNLATRIEGLTKELGEPILLSAAFAELAGNDVRAIGSYRVKGVETPQTVFAPAKLEPKQGLG
jgi:adenylate cyclase